MQFKVKNWQSNKHKEGGDNEDVFCAFTHAVDVLSHNGAATNTTTAFHTKKAG